MLRIALFGVGRIGRIHAHSVSLLANAELSYVYDVDEKSACEVAEKYGAKTVSDVDSALSDKNIDAVIIATPTKTHVDLIIQSAKAGKAIFCEKPIDLDIERVEECILEIASYNPQIQMGFNRRYDPNHKALRDAVTEGELGQLEAIIISSRDPSPPPAAYLETCGGLFRDMMVHDFDLARFILNEEIVEINASGSVLMDNAVGFAGDVDSAMVIMKTASGKLCHINCSRRATYGYDQRVEAFGEQGMLISNNLANNSVQRFDQSNSFAQEPLPHFFTERYKQAYIDQIHSFADNLAKGKPLSPTLEDGRRSLILANAAGESLRSRITIEVDYSAANL